MKGRWKVAVAALGGLALVASAQPLRAQDAPPFSKQTTLWVDQKTGEVFIRPGRGRAPMTFGVSAEQIEQEVEQRTQQRTQDAVRAAVAQTEAQQRYDNAEMQKQVEQIKPAWTSYMTNFQNKFRIGALAYMDYSFYTHTGFGPQFLENMNPPGPYNNSYNSFDITHAHGEAPAPQFVARLLTRQEFVEHDRCVLGPQSARRAEIGDAALRRDPGAGEWHDDFGLVYHGLEARHRGIEVWSDHASSPNLPEPKAFYYRHRD